jgi:hypothetical protein
MLNDIRGDETAPMGGEMRVHSSIQRLVLRRLDVGRKRWPEVDVIDAGVCQDAMPGLAPNR